VRRVTASFDPRETREEKSIVGTFTTAHVILAKAKKAVCRTHDLQGIFTIELRRSGDGQQLHVAESATAIQDERDLQGVYLLRTTVSELAPDGLWKMYMLLSRVASGTWPSPFVRLAPVADSAYASKVCTGYTSMTWPAVMRMEPWPFAWMGSRTL